MDAAFRQTASKTTTKLLLPSNALALDARFFGFEFESEGGVAVLLSFLSRTVAQSFLTTDLAFASSKKVPSLVFLSPCLAVLSRTM